jgi:hypothetical protein
MTVNAKVKEPTRDRKNSVMTSLPTFTGTKTFSDKRRNSRTTSARKNTESPRDVSKKQSTTIAHANSDLQAQISAFYQPVAL